MTDFFRFPHIPHIAWMGESSPRGDKELTPPEVNELLASTVIVEEKVDGANIGISIVEDNQLQLQNRGQYLGQPYSGQFTRLNSWLGQHQFSLQNQLDSNCIVFGEWCAARHSLDYDGLPDWFLLFDVYDRKAQAFWSVERRDKLAASLGLSAVPKLYQGKTSLPELMRLLNNSKSCYRNGSPEGIIIRKDSAKWCEGRAKLVRAEFTQTIEEHWRSRKIEWNRLSAY